MNIFSFTSWISKLSLFTLIIWGIKCYAEPLVAPTPELLMGTANYQQMLAWARQEIQKEAETDYTAAEIQMKLDHFPLVVREHCGDMQLLFIQNTPQCGNVNCNFLMFREVSMEINQLKYVYMGDVGFAAVHLFCYPKKQHYSYYLLTNWHDNNAVSTLNLQEILKNKMVPRGTRIIDYAQKNQAEIVESLWGQPVGENSLLEIFSKQ